MAASAEVRTTGSCSHSGRGRLLGKQGVKTLPNSTSSGWMSEKRMISLVDRRRELEAQRGEVMAEAAGEAGAEPGCGAGVSEGFLPPPGPLNRAEGGRHLLRWAQLRTWTPET